MDVLQFAAVRCSSLPTPLDLPEVKARRVLATPGLERQHRRGADGQLLWTWHQPPVRVLSLATGVVFEFETRAHHAIHPDDPLSASSEFHHRMWLKRPDGVAEVSAHAGVRAEADAFLVSGRIAGHPPIFPQKK